jgi:hypothetical protein
VVISRVEGSEGGDGGGDGRGKGHRVSSSDGATELSAVDKFENIQREFLVICGVSNSARGLVEIEEGGPVSCEESVATGAEDGVLMG